MALTTRPDVTLIEWAKNLTNSFPGGQPNRIEPPASHKNNGWGFEEYPPAEYFNSWMYNMYVHGKWNGDSVVDLNTRVTLLEGATGGGKSGTETLGDQTGLVTIDSTIAAYHTMTAIGNITLGVPVGSPGLSEGGELHFVEITQDNIGSRTVTIDASIDASVKAELSTDPNVVDLLTFLWTGTKWLLIDIDNDFRGQGDFVDQSGAFSSGDIMISMDDNIPIGWIDFSNGAEISRTTYAGIFARYGTMFGSGNGSTTFNVPSSAGYFMRIMSDSGTGDPDSGSRTNRGDGQTGAYVGTKQTDELKSHNHSYTSYLEFKQLPNTSTNTQGWRGTTSVNTGSTGGSETRPKNINIRIIAKV